jgi:hypothetical protein
MEEVGANWDARLYCILYHESCFALIRQYKYCSNARILSHRNSVLAPIILAVIITRESYSRDEMEYLKRTLTD